MKLVIIFLILLNVFVIVQAGTNANGLRYLELNKLKEGVISLPSGLQYKVLRAGAGAFHPSPSTPCECHYAGTLIDGTEFDSSYSRGSPATFAPNQVIKGWTEALQLMVEGDKWELYIPSELGYGDAGSGAKIQGGDVLVFTIELLKLKGDRAQLVPAVTCNPQTGDDCSEKELKFVEKFAHKAPADIENEYNRLARIRGTSMSADLQEWVERRINILAKLKK